MCILWSYSVNLKNLEELSSFKHFNNSNIYGDAIIQTPNPLQ